jgi:hypothetical protein
MSQQVLLANTQAGTIRGQINDNFAELYTATDILSTNNKNVYTTVNSNSASWSSRADTGVRAITGNWENTYSTVYANSAQWATDSTSDTGVRALTGNWQNTYSTVYANSADWGSFNYVHSNFLPLTGGTLTGNTRVNANLTIFGDLSCTGTQTFANTVFTTTSALSVVHFGSGPALWVGNNGSGDIASFYDMDQNVEILHVGGNNGTFPNVGVKTSEPNKTLTVNGEISASGNIWTSGQILSSGVDLSSIISPGTDVTTSAIDFTLSLSDASSIKRLDTSTSDFTVIIPLETTVSFDIGTQIVLANISTNVATISGETGVNLISKGDKFKLSSRGSIASLFKTASDEWVIVGDLTL